MTKLILMNGPRGSGKSKAKEYLLNYFDLATRECKGKLHELTIAFFNIDEALYWKTYHDQDKKELPMPQFKMEPDEYNKVMAIVYPDRPIQEGDPVAWLSLRQAMIYVSEIICKPAFGRDYFGQIRADSILEGETAFDDSAGFEEELPPVIDKLGQENILLIRVHGHGDASGDSRQMIGDGVIENTVDLSNNGTLDEWLDKVHSEVTAFLSASPSPGM